MSPVNPPVNRPSACSPRVVVAPEVQPWKSQPMNPDSEFGCCFASPGTLTADRGLAKLVEEAVLS